MIVQLKLVVNHRSTQQPITNMKFIAVCASLLWLGQVTSSIIPQHQPRQQFKAEVLSSGEIIPADRTIKIETNPVPTGTREVLPELPEGVEPQTTGTVYTDISSRQNPLLTSSIPEPRRLLKPVASPTLDAYGAEMTGPVMDKRQNANIFASPRVQNDPKSGVAKYNFLLEDGTTWIVYGYATSGSMLDLQLVNQGPAQSRAGSTGVVQIVKNPGDANGALDDGAGIYPTGVRLSVSVSGSSGSYSLNFNRAGHS